MSKTRTSKLDKIRLLVAQMYCASGCSCCRDDDEWHRTTGELAKLLDIPAYSDHSGYEFHTVVNQAKEKKP